MHQQLSEVDVNSYMILNYDTIEASSRQLAEFLGFDEAFAQKYRSSYVQPSGHAFGVSQDVENYLQQVWTHERIHRDFPLIFNEGETEEGASVCEYNIVVH
jgi:hypothetical protein